MMFFRILLTMFFVLSAPASAQAAPLLPVEVIDSRPHSTTAYTQGLFFLDGQLYESAGLYGQSSLARVDLDSGAAQLELNLSSEFFAEGADAAEGEIYLLTWREHTCFVVDPQTLKVKRSHSYSGEGWGLAWDGQTLWRSDGSARLHPHRPGDFAPAGKPLTVKDGQKEITHLNELEWHAEAGLMLANVYGRDLVAAIDLSDGQVRYWLDAGKLRQMAALEGLPKTENPWDTVLNGLAIAPEGLWLTGKLWPRRYLISWPAGHSPAPSDAGASAPNPLR